MLSHTEKFLHIVFGGVSTAFNPRDYKNLASAKQLLHKKPFDQLKNFMHIEQLMFLHQVHSDHGLLILDGDNVATMKPFSHDGDFLLTSCTGLGLAVATADCLPIILYSSACPALSIIHAGWRGTMQQVAVKALDVFKCTFELDTQTIQVFFGPSAKKCCYTVGPEIVNILDNFPFKDQVLYTHKNQTFFDLSLCNQLQLQEAGIPKEAFTMNYNYCTICTTSFCSYRRQHQELRNMTVAALRPRS